MEWKIIFTGAKSASEYLFCINSEATPTLKEENTGRWSLLNIASEQPENHKGTVFIVNQPLLNISYKQY